MVNRRGLSLLETTIAIAVIVTGLFAAFTLVLSNRRAGDEARFRFGAVAVAREGVEVVRAIRDSNWLGEDTRTWDEGIAGSAGSYTGVARFNPSDASWQLTYGPESFPDAQARLVVRSSASGQTYWTQGAGGDEVVTETPYRRLIETFPICADRSVVERGAACDPDASPANPKVGIRVRSRVRWATQGRTHEVVAEEQLFNWK
ncbi:hypothetical protein HY634_04260 [Candidatus Uhrbacteria bacterium]|nr:hypothetical protein [Candidatus Uhrbacteria bacterium]